MTIDVLLPFGFACLFWGVVLMAGVLADRESFVRENKPRWKVMVLSVVFLVTGVLCFTCRLL